MATQIIRGLTSQVDKAARLSDLKIRTDKLRNKKGQIEVSSKNPESIATLKDYVGLKGDMKDIGTVIKDGTEREVRAQTALSKMKSHKDISFKTKAARKKSANLRKQREQLDEDAIRTAENELGVYSSDGHVKLMENEKRKIKDLEDQIRTMNREAGETLYSLGHIISLDKGGLHVRDNMVIEPYRTTKDRVGNSARSSLDDITDQETLRAISAPTSYKVWVAQQFFPELRGFDELTNDDIVDIMGGTDWQTALEKRQALNAESRQIAS